MEKNHQGSSEISRPNPHVDLIGAGGPDLLPFFVPNVGIDWWSASLLDPLRVERRSCLCEFGSFLPPGLPARFLAFSPSSDYDREDEDQQDVGWLQFEVVCPQKAQTSSVELPARTLEHSLIASFECASITPFQVKSSPSRSPLQAHLLNPTPHPSSLASRFPRLRLPSWCRSPTGSIRGSCRTDSLGVSRSRRHF